jgi:hypothetical protein
MKTLASLAFWREKNNLSQSRKERKEEEKNLAYLAS